MPYVDADNRGMQILVPLIKWLPTLPISRIVTARYAGNIVHKPPIDRQKQLWEASQALDQSARKTISFRAGRISRQDKDGEQILV